MLTSAVEFECDPDWPAELNAEVNGTLERLMEDVDGDIDLDDPNHEWAEPPSGDPFCGCETCVQREMLTIAVTRTVEAVAAGRIRIDGLTLSPS